MARKVFKPRKHESGRVITTKTPYGITSDMVVTDESILSQLSIEDRQVLVHDDSGYFIVPRDRVNDGLACPLRYCDSYRDMMDKQFAFLNEAK